MDGVMMCHAPFLGQMVDSRDHRGRYHVCDHAHWTALLHMWHKYNPWGGNVSRTISQSQDQRSRQSALSVTSLHVGHKYNPWGTDMSRTISMSKSSIVNSIVNQYVMLCAVLSLPIITYVTLKWFVCFLCIIPPMSEGFFLHVCPLKYPFVI